jgi:hypothetical protein
LLAGYDDDASPPGTGNKLAVRILAVQKRHRFMFSKEEEEQGLSYQVLVTSSAGAIRRWKRSRVVVSASGWNAAARWSAVTPCTGSPGLA